MTGEFTGTEIPRRIRVTIHTTTDDHYAVIENLDSPLDDAFEFYPVESNETLEEEVQATADSIGIETIEWVYS